MTRTASGICAFLFFVFMGTCLPALGDVATDCKTMAKEVKADIRAVENMNDQAQARSKIKDIKDKIEKIRTMDPQYVELSVLVSKCRFLENTYGSEETDQASAKPQVDESVKEQTLKDWEALVQLKKGFLPELTPIIPTYQKTVIYTEDNVDEVVAKITDLRKRAPEVKKALDAFKAKYGSEQGEIDTKIQDLTPKDPKVGMYEGKNQRPDEGAGGCYADLVDGLTNLEEAPKIEAKRILTQAIENIDLIESFTMDTERDKQYQEVLAKIEMGLKFNPQDAELQQWKQKLAQMRQKSKADVEKSMDSATFPGHMKGFAGPGNPDQLAASAIQYFNEKDPNQTTLAVSIAGNWVVAKQNIFGDPIEWGLPIWAASVHNDEKDIARVFKLTLLTAEGLGVKQAPPWDGEWVGDSYRMRAKNIKP